MIQWYFSKLGPVFGIAIAVPVLILVLSVLVALLDRDRPRHRGFSVHQGDESDPDADRSGDSETQ